MYLIYAMLYPQTLICKYIAKFVSKLLQICNDPIYRSFLRGQKVLKSEFAVEAIVIFVKSIKKASSSIFTLYESQ